MKRRPHVAILASGNGSTAEAFIRASADSQIEVAVGLIICNNPDAGIFKRVALLNAEYSLSVPVTHISHLTHPPAEDEVLVRGQQTEAEERALIQVLKKGDFDAICLMGYMKLIGPKVVHEFGWRPDYTSPYQAKMLNTHPGLLPLTKGLYGIYAQSHTLAEQATHGGHTLHIVAEDYDDGPIVSEHKVPVEPHDTAEALFERVQLSEKKHLPSDIALFIKKRQQYMEGK